MKKLTRDDIVGGGLILIGFLGLLVNVPFMGFCISVGLLILIIG